MMPGESSPSDQILKSCTDSGGTGNSPDRSPSSSLALCSPLSRPILPVEAVIQIHIEEWRATVQLNVVTQLHAGLNPQNDAAFDVIQSI